MEIPLIDISGFTSADGATRARVVDHWRGALDSLGFVTISGHGVDEALIDQIYTTAVEFFEQPEARKCAAEFGATGAEGRGSKGAGFVRLAGQAVGRTRDGPGLPDLAESLTFLAAGSADLAAVRRSMESNIWPDRPSELRGLVERYAWAASDLALRLMRLSALALGLPESWFDPYYAPMACRLRLAWYPEQAVPPEPGQLRNAAHTDFGCLTILRQDNAPGGLQVLAPDGAWIDVAPAPGTFVINTGDLLQRWTNDRWRSNVHRVVNPPRVQGVRTKRLSVVFFTSPRLDSTITCLPTCQSPARPPAYQPFIAADHMKLRIAQTYGGI